MKEQKYIISAIATRYGTSKQREFTIHATTRDNALVKFGQQLDENAEVEVVECVPVSVFG